jgi:DNA-binding NarL/FixJ family response regulator
MRTDAGSIRVLTVDDHPLLREGIAALISAVAAELANHGAEADVTHTDMLMLCD